jgi:hypothetical protein
METTKQQIENLSNFDRKGYIVLLSNGDDDKTVIALEKWFEEKLNDDDVYYDKYGQEKYVGGEDSIGPFVGYDYHDGHNWRTVTISADFFNSDFSRLQEDEEREILEAYFIKSFESEVQGIKHYNANGYLFKVSAWQGSWEIATVEKND